VTRAPVSENCINQLIRFNCIIELIRFFVKAGIALFRKKGYPTEKGRNQNERFLWAAVGGRLEKSGVKWGHPV
jgi:hypothetical protein